MNILTLLALTTLLAPSVEAANKPLLEIPFEYRTGLIVVPATLNGSDSLRTILDTGMPMGAFLFDPALGQELKLEYFGSANVGAPNSGSTTMASVGGGATIGLGNINFTEQRTIVLNERNDIANLGVQAVIGESVFRSYVVQIDYDTQTVRLFDKEGFDPSAAGTEFPITIQAGKPYMKGSVQVADGSQVAVDLMVDTGKVGTLSLFAKSDARLKPPAIVVKGVVSAGVGGPIQGARGRVAGVHLGPFEIADVVVEFPEDRAGDSTFRNGILGQGLLRQFVATYDYENLRIFLKPAKRYQQAFEFNMAGFVLRNLSEGVLRVDDVLPESPGAESGIQTGDRIVSINGEKVLGYNHWLIEEMFSKPGKKLRLSVERDSERFEAKLRLRRMI